MKEADERDGAYIQDEINALNSIGREEKDSDVQVESGSEEHSQTQDVSDYDGTQDEPQSSDASRELQPSQSDPAPYSKAKLVAVKGRMKAAEMSIG